jgi:pimeloyl-ACP methyl ester carboxylesterase
MPEVPSSSIPQPQAPSGAAPVPCAYTVTDARQDRDDDTPTLVLIHGVGLDRTMWRHQVDALALHAPVLTYDLRGHGASPARPLVTSLADYVADLHWLLTERLRSGPVDLCGFSLGGLIAQAFAIAHPELVHRMVLSNTFARTDADRAEVRRRAEDVRNGSSDGDRNGSLVRWFTPDFLATGEAGIAWIGERLAANDRDAYLAAHQLTVVGDQCVADDLDRIAAPTLVLTAEDDIERPQEYVEALVDFLYAGPAGPPEDQQDTTGQNE